jgi:hypothetical protein
MNHIFNLAILGAFSGMIAVFWSRIISRKMIFSSFGAWLDSFIRDEDKRVYDVFMQTELSKKFLLMEKITFFLQCFFCLAPWWCFTFDAFYIIEFHPWWLYAVIGILAGLGMGNFICELIHALRKEHENL